MRVSGINSINSYRANFNKVNSNVSSPCGQLNANKNTAMGVDVLNFMGINGQYGVKKYVSQEVQSTIDDFRETDESVQTLVKNAQKHFKEAGEEIIDKGQETIKDSQKTYNEVMALYEKGNKTDSDGSVLRRIKQKDNAKIMEEFDEYGEIKRLSVLNGETLRVQEGIEELDDGTIKIAKEMKFENGELRKYTKGYEESLDGATKTEQEMHFYFGQLNFYRENHEKHPDGYEKTQKEASLAYGGVFRYIENDEKLANRTKSIEALYMDDKYEFNQSFMVDGTVKTQKALRFTTNGELCRYTENDEIFPDGSRAIDKNINYDDGKPTQYQKNYQKTPDGSWEKSAVIIFKDGKANNCIIDIKGSPYGLESLKEYELSNNSWQKVK